MLLHEFLKEHRKVEEQAATITQLTETLDIVLAGSTNRIRKFNA
jgi:hypothetical protein